MPKQILVAVALFLIMAGGVAWIAFVLVKAMPVLSRIYGATAAMKRRTDLLKAGDSRRLSELEIDEIRQMTNQLQGNVKGEMAMRLVEHELELADLAKSAVASGDWEKAQALLAGLRRTWP
jgi:hypothetical protein